MERATIYRALSAPAALAGGALSIVCASLLIAGQLDAPWQFATGWFLVFLITVTVSAWLLRKDAQRRNQQFLSPAARAAALAMEAKGGKCVGIWCAVCRAVNPVWLILCDSVLENSRLRSFTACTSPRIH